MGRPRSDRGTEVAQPGWLVPAFAVAGAGLGWGATFLARWLVTLPVAPMRKPAELVNSIPDPWRTVALVAAGLVAGLVGGLLVLHHELSVRVSGDAVSLTVADEPREFRHDRVALAFQDRGHLVLLDHEGGELAREKCDLNASRLAAAFTGHGYPWAEHDPHEGEFRRWVPGTPGLPEGANALLTARAHALRKSDDARDRRELRDELAAVGVYVRDEKKRQFVRTR